MRVCVCVVLSDSPHIIGQNITCKGQNYSHCRNPMGYYGRNVGRSSRSFVLNVNYSGMAPFNVTWIHRNKTGAKVLQEKKDILSLTSVS